MAFLIHFDADFVGGIPEVASGATTITTVLATSSQVQGKFSKALQISADGAGIECSLTYAFGNPQTVEVQLNVGSETGNYASLVMGPTDPYWKVHINRLASGDLECILNGTTLGTVSLSGFVPVALVVNSSIAELFVNGSSLGTITLAESGAVPSSLQVIGSAGTLVDELRSSDSALYSANYTPKIVPFSPADPSVALYSQVGQVRAVGVRVSSEPLPDFSTYLTQIRMVDLIGTLTDTLQDGTTLTQLKLQTIDAKPISNQPLLFAVEKQVLQATEPADWIHTMALQNLVVKQEVISGGSYLHTVVNTVGVVDEAAPLPQRRLSQLTQHIITTDAYVHPLGVRSMSVLPSLSQLIAVQQILANPSDLQGLTTQLSLTQGLSVTQQMKDPADLRTGSMAWGLTQFLSMDQQMVDPSILQSPVKSVKTSSTASIVEQYDDPLDARSMSRGLGLATVVGLPDQYPDPADLRGSANQLFVKQTASIVEQYDDPSVLQSKTREFLLDEKVSQQDAGQPDPKIMQSKTREFMLAQASAQQTTLPDPTTLAASVEQIQMISSTSVQEPFVDPADLNSSILQLQDEQKLSLDDPNYVDPNWLYQEPARNYHTFELVAFPWHMENPNGRRIPIVNVNYYWGYA